MSQSVIILGRQPALGLAELESLLGPVILHPINQHAVLVDIAATDLAFSRLGGSMKVAKLLTTLPSTHWEEIQSYLVKIIPGHLQFVPEGKFRLGLSVYDLSIKPERINATGLTIKKVIKATGRSVRIVPNKTPALSTAQVIHNQLTGPTGWELLVINDGKQTVLAQTVQVQDIEAYAARDQARPKRDARVGMLPPKLAQIIVNLAVGDMSSQASKGQGSHASDFTLLDPFCGTGVLLQEALLMGFEVFGSDLEPRMVEYSQKNLEWLDHSYMNFSQYHPRHTGLIPATTYKLETGDATAYTWIPMPNFIATETYLGRPFASEPRPEVLQEVMRDVDTILRKFLQNVARQTKPGFRLCLAVPAWKTSAGFKHLKSLASLEELGYNRIRFQHVRNEELIYHREDQIVGRELVTLIRK